MPSHPEVIRQLLIDGGLAFPKNVDNTLPDWYITTGFMQNDRPWKRIAVYNTGGKNDGRIMKTGTTIVFPSWLIRVQSDDYISAEDKIAAIKNFLDAVYRQSVTVRTVSMFIQQVHVTIPPVHIGRNKDVSDVDLELFTLNGYINVKEAN